MSLKFSCPYCGVKIVTQFLKCGESARCPKCSNDIVIPEDAIVTNEKSTILNSAISRPKEKPNQVDRDETNFANAKYSSDLCRKLTWKEIYYTIRESLMVLKYKYFLVIYLLNLLVSLFSTIIITSTLRGSYYISLIDLIVFITLCALFFIYLHLFFILIIIKLRNRQNIEIGQCVKKVFKILPKVLVANLIVAVCVTMGLILLVIPGITLAFYFIFVNQIIVIENASIIETLKTSIRAVNSNFWKIVFLVISFYVVIYLLGVLLGMYNLYLVQTRITVMNILHIIYFILSAFITLLFQSFTTFLYIKISNKNDDVVASP